MKIQFEFDNSGKVEYILNKHFHDIDHINTGDDLYKLVYSVWHNDYALEGISDRTNPGKVKPCTIIWARYRGEDYQLIVDADHPHIIINVFPLRENVRTLYYRMKKYNLKPIQD